jgi:hypothetical protein
MTEQQKNELLDARKAYNEQVDQSRALTEKFTTGDNAHQYKVKSVPLFTADGVPADAWGNFREDTKAIIGVTSDRYGILQNDEFERVIKTGLASRGLNPTSQKISVVKWGSRVHFQYDFKDASFEVPTKKVGDIICLRITAHNSFDGTSKSSISVGAVRLVCSNGMTCFDSELSLSAKHVSTIDPVYCTDVVDEAVRQWGKLQSRFTLLAQTPITHNDGQGIINAFVNRGVYSERMSKHIIERWKNPSFEHDEERSIWNLYNAHTEVFTHGLSERNMEHADHVSRKVLFNLTKASKDPVLLAELSNSVAQHN